MDIYFQGYGFWFAENEPGEPLNKLIPTYLANGVFRLNDGDAIKFRHTKSIDGIHTLCPSSHNDDEFSKVAKDGSLKGYKPERCWFGIDSSINTCTGIEPIAVIAEPNSPSGVLEVEHVETPIAANKFSIDALIETMIPALFIKAKIYNDPFTQGIYKVRWVKMLKKERDYLSGLDFSDLRESRLQRINAKLKDFQKWANDYGQKATKPASAKVIQAEVGVNFGVVSNDNITTVDGGTFISRNCIKLIFDKLNKEQWRGHFTREKTNGLLAIRQGEPRKPEYQLDKISKWLKDKALYSEADIKLAITKYNEPSINNTQANKRNLRKPNFGNELMALTKKI